MNIREEAKKLGFEELPHFTIGNSVVYQLGRHRRLSLNSAGTPNEILAIAYDDGQDRECIILHNYDYDGYITLEKLQLILSFFNYETNRKV